MNVLDFILLLAGAATFAALFRYGAICSLIVFAGMAAGFVAGVLIASKIITPNTPTAQAGLSMLFLVLVPALLCGGLAWWSVKRLHVRLLLTQGYAVDRMLGWPVKFLGLIGGIVLLAQVLPYVPLVPMYFQAQGSTVLYTAYRFGPEIPALSDKLQRSKADQFYAPVALGKNAALERLNPVERSFFAPLVQSSVRITGPVCLTGGGVSGSGSVIEGGYIVTNAHVVRLLREVNIETEHGTYPATPLAVDNKNDLAVLYTRYLDTAHMPQVRLRDTNVAEGSLVHVLGYPGGGKLSIDTGLKVGSYAKQSNVYYSRGDSQIMAFTMPAGTTTHGSSGSPVLDESGYLAGVLYSGSDKANMAGVIPVESLLPLVEKARHAIKPVRTGC